MQPMNNESPDPATSAQDEDGAGAQPIAIIEVSVMNDGTIQIEQESAAQEQAESGEAEAPNEGAPVTVKNAQEAVELIEHMIASAQGGQTAQQNIAQQSAGYSGS